MKDITGNMVTLRPAVLRDRRSVFEWLAHSDVTRQMLGAPHYPDNPPPTWDEFISDYTEQFFTDFNPELGRCFIIEVNGEAKGQISYNKVWIEEGIVELDIWLGAKRHTGKGFGSDALNTICGFLFEEFGCTRFLIAPSRRNSRAIRAYSKAGFLETKVIPSWFVPDYSDSIVLIKELHPDRISGF